VRAAREFLIEISAVIGDGKEKRRIDALRIIASR
jgi:hypothetical protein